MQILGNNITNLKQKNRSDNFLRLNKIRKVLVHFFVIWGLWLRLNVIVVNKLISRNTDQSLRFLKLQNRIRLLPIVFDRHFSCRDFCGWVSDSLQIFPSIRVFVRNFCDGTHATLCELSKFCVNLLRSFVCVFIPINPINLLLFLKKYSHESKLYCLEKINHSEQINQINHIV